MIPFFHHCVFFSKTTNSSCPKPSSSKVHRRLIKIRGLIFRSSLMENRLYIHWELFFSPLSPHAVDFSTFAGNGGQTGKSNLVIQGKEQGHFPNSSFKSLALNSFYWEQVLPTMLHTAISQIPTHLVQIISSFSSTSRSLVRVDLNSEQAWTVVFPCSFPACVLYGWRMIQPDLLTSVNMMDGLNHTPYYTLG